VTGAQPSAALPGDGWIDAVGVPATVLRSVVRQLRLCEITLVQPAHDGRPPNGVLLFTVSGPQVLATLRAIANRGRSRIIAISTTGHVTADDSWALLRAGASDVLAWHDPAQVAELVAARLRRWEAIDEMTACDHVRRFLVGPSQVWQRVVREAVEIGRFTNAAVLITGESGTGKERVAQLIHELDPRPSKGRIVVLDCSTVVPSLSGSEFFGHEKGAFTGASMAREGAFELANGGTLFLDEVGELSLALQAELLRVIQEGTFKRVGSNMWRRSSFRLVCATNRHLDRELASGSFRHDFYYRIAGCRLHLPSLRERPEDIIHLFRHFYADVHADAPVPEVDEAVRDLLTNRPYPGNVRDLRNLAVRIAHRHLGHGAVTVGDVPDNERPDSIDGSATDATDLVDGMEQAVRQHMSGGSTLDQLTDAVADAAIRVAVDDAAGDVREAARRLGVPVEAVQDRCPGAGARATA
jgi:DNA-binding NtrC family response regulator